MGCAGYSGYGDYYVARHDKHYAAEKGIEYALP